jgi:hypothetical protein
MRQRGGMGKKEDAPKPSEIRKEKKKLLKVLVLLAKVYRKGAKGKAQKSAYTEVEATLKELRKHA